MQQYQPNMVQNGQPQIQSEMQQYQQPQLPQMQQISQMQQMQQMPQMGQIPQMPQMGQMGQMVQMQQMPPMQYQQPMQQLPDLPKIEQGPITNENFHPLRLTCDEPERDVIAGTGQKSDPQNPKPAQYYFNIPLKANYGSFTEKDCRTFFYEGCELTTLYGIKSETNQFGKFKSSIGFSLDERDPDQVKFMSDFDTISSGGAQLVFHYKDKINYPLFDASNPKIAQATGYRPLITRKAGKNPALYCDLIDYTTDAFSAKTLFTYGSGEDTKVLDWKDLKGMTFKCIPLFRFKKIYVGGGKSSLQYDVKSALVTTPPVPFKAVSMQAGTAQRLAEKRTNWGDDIEAQIARNNMLNQDKKLGADLYIAPKTEIKNTTSPSIEISQQTVPSIETAQNTQNTQTTSTNLEQFMNSNPQQPILQFS